MIYRDFQDLKLSALGMGAMRLPVFNNDDGNVDQETVDKMVALAIDKGVNYFDTAWGYHNGTSEIALGKSFQNIPGNLFILPISFPVMI